MEGPAQCRWSGYLTGPTSSATCPADYGGRRKGRLDRGRILVRKFAIHVKHPSTPSGGITGVLKVHRFIASGGLALMLGVTGVGTSAWKSLRTARTRARTSRATSTRRVRRGSSSTRSRAPGAARSPTRSSAGHDDSPGRSRTRPTPAPRGSNWRASGHRWPRGATGHSRWREVKRVQPRCSRSSSDANEVAKVVRLARGPRDLVPLVVHIGEPIPRQPLRG